MLKAQSNTSYTGGVIEVQYDAVNQVVQVWTYAETQNWVQRGADIPVTFVNGDRFGARARANGTVEVYRNGSLLGTRELGSWPYVANGGYLGLWFSNATNATIDDFGGGTATALPTPTPTATNTPALPTPTPLGGFTDNFDRADSSDVGANWTERIGDFAIVAHVLQNANTICCDIVATYNGATFSNAAITARMQNHGALGTPSLGIRLGNYSNGLPTSGYTVELQDNGALVLWRVNDWTVLGSYALSNYTRGNWVTVTLRASGTTLSVEEGGITRITATDYLFTSGHVGVWSWNSSAVGEHRFDDFSVQLLNDAYQELEIERVKAIAWREGEPKQVTVLAIGSLQANTTITKYYYFNGTRVAMKQGSTVTYLHTDHLGSTSVASNASGALVARQTYFPYGAPRTSEGTLPTDYTFTGQRVDASAGLMYYGARYYDAALGRFIQPDTIIPNLYDPQSLNRYTYVRNNPLRYKDPSGHFPIDWLIDIGSILFDIHQLITEPSWENAGWLAADVVLGITPYVPASAGPAAKAAKAAQAANKVADATKSVDIVRATSKADEAGQAFAKAARLAGDIDAAKQLIKEAGKEDKVIVIGRTMNPRVKAIAEKLGAKTFPGDRALKGTALLEKNLEWLQKMIDEGYVIVDIGADSSRGPLKPGEIDFYAWEAALVKERGYNWVIRLDDIVPPSGDRYWHTPY